MSPHADTPELSRERTDILAKTLPHVPFTGWSEETLRLAVKEAGYAPLMAQRAFPDGPAGLVDAFCQAADEAMLKAIDIQAFSSLKIREKVATAVEARLAHHAYHKEAIRHALAFYALPLHSGRGLKRLYATVDAIWYACGDTATDWNFYSKRLLLAGVYSSTLTYWLGDESDDYQDTHAFLRRRIEEVMQIPKVKAKLAEPFAGVKQWVEKVAL